MVGPISNSLYSRDIEVRFGGGGVGPVDQADADADLMKQVSVVDEPPGLDDVVAYYVEHHLMPADAQGDAAHLAMASMHAIDFLLTWNCRHLANANKIQHIAVLNRRLGLSVPVVTTPLALLSEDVP